MSTIKLFLVLVLVTVSPAISSAGLFSFMGIGDAEKKDHPPLDKSLNSQNMGLLYAALNPDPNPSKGGGDITVVGGALLSETGPSGTLADIENAPKKENSGQISVYVVREGDNISQIADMYGVSANTIIWANDLPRTGLITEGQRLIILPVSGVRHIVKSGETLAGIVKKYKGDLEEVMKYNGFGDGTKLAVGDVVVIPDGEIAAPAPAVRRSSGGGGRPVYEGYYMRPIKGGQRTQGLHGYNGVDLASYYGAPIYAAASGRVIISKNYGWNGGYGNYVVVEHPNGTQTLYSHNSRNAVSAGQWVVQGEVIGYVGSSGRSTGPHVHFEVRGARNPF